MDSDVLTTLTALFNVNGEAITGAVLVIVFVLNALKEHEMVRGKAVLWWAGGLSIACGWIIGHPFFEAIFANSLAIFVLTVGGWATFKRLAKKVGANTKPT